VVQELGLAEISADVRQGSRCDVILHAVGANVSRGLKRSDAPQRKAANPIVYDAPLSRLTADALSTPPWPTATITGMDSEGGRGT
jgi:hypothetical protein